MVLVVVKLMPFLRAESPQPLSSMVCPCCVRFPGREWALLGTSAVRGIHGYFEFEEPGIELEGSADALGKRTS